MSLETRLTAIVQALGADVKKIKADVAAGNGGAVVVATLESVPAGTPANTAIFLKS